MENFHKKKRLDLLEESENHTNWTGEVVFNNTPSPKNIIWEAPICPQVVKDM